MESVSTSKDGGHSHHSHPLVGFVDAHMALVAAHMGHHSDEEGEVPEYRMGRHTDGVVEEDNHPCAEAEEECDAHTHCDHSSHDEVEVNAPGNGHEGCIREVVHACRNHPWEDTLHDEVSGTCKGRA